MPKFGQWIILESLSEGGQGWTYLAYRAGQSKEEPVVLKRLKNPQRRERLEREISALGKLSHPGIVRIIDHQLEGDHPYLVMEYCAGGDLGRIDLNGLTGVDKLKLFHQVCRAVAAAHEAGVIHRDLKPKNILLRDNLVAVVADFGLSMDLSDLENRVTEIGEAVGPRDYIAPELEGGPTSDPRPSSDCYSLGKLLYFLLGGRNLPRERHRAAPYNLISETAPALVHFAYELFDRSICEEAANRFKSAGEFLIALEGVMERVDKSAHVLDLNVAQPCLYCIGGSYQLRLLHEPGARRPASPPFSAHHFWGDSDNFQHTPWMILTCDTCGNVQMFRTDLGASPTRWKNVPKTER